MVDAFESMNFIHSGLEYSLLLYVHLYLFSFCRPQLDGIDPGRFNWHWLEVVAFFIFMLWAPETIRETLKNAENDGLEAERDGKLDDWKKDLDRRVRELENKK